MVVAEVTQPSLGVGYELGRAVTMGKKIFCLFRPSSGRREVTSCRPVTPSHSSPYHFLSVCLSVRPGLSAMIRGADDGGAFTVSDYSEDNLDQVLEQLFRNSQPIS